MTRSLSGSSPARITRGLSISRGRNDDLIMKFRSRTDDETAVRLAVITHIRHRETDYYRLLAKGYERRQARTAVESNVSSVINGWLTLHT